MRYKDPYIEKFMKVERQKKVLFSQFAKALLTAHWLSRLNCRSSAHSQPKSRFIWPIFYELYRSLLASVNDRRPQQKTQAGLHQLELTTRLKYFQLPTSKPSKENSRVLISANKTRCLESASIIRDI